MTSQKTFFAFQRFGYHVSVEHDEKHPQPKFGGNRFMVAPRDMAAFFIYLFICFISVEVALSVA